MGFLFGYDGNGQYGQSSIRFPLSYWTILIAM